ncbi:GPP34 family phosphoprotein [Rhodococcus sp. X156]|uniref:GOLPH3/VPS74 family protein n=1 Tax=Rhodococcus sp. X156 TaxID=2499145 RepID=UPI000FDB35DE|nr:GPP34 family phosphoprotein [Rhodococcus sp. X156]
MTDQLLLAEELFLLTHDDTSGKADVTLALDEGLAGALLLDLAAESLLGAKGKTVVAAPGTPAHPLLAAAHDELLAADRPRSAGHWVRRLPTALKPLAPTVGRSLVQRGLLTEEHRKVLKLFPTTTWPTVDSGPEKVLRARLGSVLVDGTTPDPRTALLIALLHPLDLAGRAVDKPHRKAAKARAKAISQETQASAAVSGAVAQSVQAVQAAVLSAVTVTTVAASGSS